MRARVFFESLVSFLDVGAVVESLTRFRRHGFDIGFFDVCRRLLFGRGYTSVTPPQLSGSPTAARIIDLRRDASTAEKRIPGAEPRPFDDFLRDVVRDGWLTDDLEQPIVLVCDTGHLSRVAAAILAEEVGFARVASVAGGMRRWSRWMRIARAELPLAGACCAPRIES
jgi:rhodanese-related sulfurtransferase